MNYEKAAEQAKELVAKMTVQEKISQLIYNSPAIERLGIKEYNWWNEALHGVARAGIATVFPQAIGLAATFDDNLLGRCAGVISTEARAKYNKSVEFGDRDIFRGLTYWSPNININRDPRWGRGQETYGEDPFLTATMGKAFVKGVQGDGEYYKACACAKHFAAHSGPEEGRDGFDSKVSAKDMEETYLPAFRKCVEEGVAGVMGSYNRINGIPANANRYLIEDVLRNQWGFKGYFVSDCGAINNIWKHHHYVETAPEAAAVSLNAGCDLNCGECYRYLNEAWEADLTDEETITKAAERVYTIRFLLGEFEENRPYSDIPYEKVDCPEHRALNLEAAEQSMTLLKNENNFLPLDKNKSMRLGIIGPNALSRTALEGNYKGRAAEYITIADGMRRVFENSDIRVTDGCRYDKFGYNDWDGNLNMISDGEAVASVSDTVILCLGLDANYEGECGDKSSIMLPEIQRILGEKVCEVCDNVVVVVLAGSSLDIGEKIRSKAKAVLYGWYPGARGGLAVAEVLGGVKSPCGRLPLTIYGENNTIPDMSDYSMAGRTYRFMKEEPLYPFGFGLSYTDISYDKAEIVSADSEKIKLKATVTNKGGCDVREKIQVYAKFEDSAAVTPNYQLCGIKAVNIAAGSSATAEIEIDRYWIKAVTDEGIRKEPDGSIKLYVGSSQPDAKSRALGAPECICIEI